MKKSKIAILLVIIFGLIALSYLLFKDSSILSDASNGVFHFLKTLEQHTTISQNPEEYSCKDCNVILISIDTLRADNLGSYGYSRDTSPNIDNLASEGVLFKNAFSQSSNTLPSHMSIFTSLYPIMHRVILPGDGPLDSSIVTLPEILKQYNYTTTWFASGLHLDPKSGFGTGIDEFYGDLSNTDDWEEAYSWIGNNRQKKFFMFLHTSRIHDPYIVPSPFDKLYNQNYKGNILGEISEFSAEYLPFKEENASDFESASQEEKFQLFRKFYWQFIDTSDENDVNRLIALYDASITCCVDPFIGELMDTLEEYGLDEKTIVIITSDHGEAFGEHGNFLHQNLYYEELHIPLIVAIPSVDNKIINSQVQSIDIMPTILDVIDVPIPDNVQGQSLLPLMLGEKEQVHEYTYGYWLDVSSIRSEKWKLIRYNNGNIELYNIKDDPRERVNVAQRHPDVVKDMKNGLDEFELSTYIR